MSQIKQETKTVLDPVIGELLTVLRGLECDYPEGNMEDNISYVLSQLLNRYGRKDINSALGMLLATALDLHASK